MKQFSYFIKTHNNCKCSRCKKSILPEFDFCPYCNSVLLDLSSLNNIPYIEIGTPLFFRGVEVPVTVSGLTITKDSVLIRWEADEQVASSCPERTGEFNIREIGETAFLDIDDMPDKKYTVNLTSIYVSTSVYKINSIDDILKSQSDIYDCEEESIQYFFSYEDAKSYFDSIKNQAHSKFLYAAGYQNHFMIKFAELAEVTEEIPDDSSSNIVRDTYLVKIETPFDEPVQGDPYENDYC